MNLCKKFLLFYNTTKHLRTSQIAYRILFYLKKNILFLNFLKNRIIIIYFLTMNSKQTQNFKLQSNDIYIKNEYLNFEKNEFNFLNTEYRFGGKINWKNVFLKTIHYGSSI